MIAWILVAVFVGGSSPAGLTVPGFVSQGECMAAAKLIQKDLGRSASYTCIPQTQFK